MARKSRAQVPPPSDDESSDDDQENEPFASDVALTDSEKRLLQVFLHQPLWEDRKIQELFRKIQTEYTGGSTDLSTVCKRITEHLHFLFLELRRIQYEGDGKIYWGLINTRQDDFTSISSFYEPNALKLFKKILDTIITEPNGKGEIGMKASINFGREFELSLKESEHVIQRLCSQQWLFSPSGESLTIGPRSFLELRTYLTQNEISECPICSEPVVKGKSCSNRDCEVRLHEHCLKLVSRSATYKCPQCRTEWRSKA